jgi:hypothetical protein
MDQLYLMDPQTLYHFLLSEDGPSLYDGPTDSVQFLLSEYGPALFSGSTDFVPFPFVWRWTVFIWWVHRLSTISSVWKWTNFM